LFRKSCNALSVTLVDNTFLICDFLAQSLISDSSNPT